MGLDRFLEFKSRYGLEELREYGRMAFYSAILSSQSMVSSLFASKSPTILDYLLWLTGAAVDHLFSYIQKILYVIPPAAGYVCVGQQQSIPLSYKKASSLSLYNDARPSFYTLLSAIVYRSYSKYLQQNFFQNSMSITF